jgi:biotin operon repressor
MKQPYTTPVPNVIFDKYLRELSSSELKVLLVVIRQTLGWADHRGMFGRKETDWISGSQFKQKTGCSKRAINYAISGLIKKGLIEIHDEKGYSLDHPLDRKGKSRLFYNLSPNIYKTMEKSGYLDSTSAKFALDLRKKCAELAQNLRITKETLQN